MCSCLPIRSEFVVVSAERLSPTGQEHFCVPNPNEIQGGWCMRRFGFLFSFGCAADQIGRPHSFVPGGSQVATRDLGHLVHDRRSTVIGFDAANSLPPTVCPALL